MSLTIAIPSYNKERYIKRCIESVLLEKDLIEKILVIDNNSSDKTFELAKEYEPNIVCYKNPTNIGMSGNFNKCIEMCRSDWLMIMHADDELLPGAIKKYFELIKKYPSIGLIHADSYSINNSDPSTKQLNQNQKKEFWKAGLDAMSCHYGVCSAVMVRKDVYNKLGGFIVSSLSSDVEMWSRIASSYDIGYLNQPTVIYHINSYSTGPESLTNRTVKEIKADWDLLNKKIAESYPTEESRKNFLKKMDDLSPASYWNVAKENLKVYKFKNAFDATIVIIFTYNGLIPLIKILIDLVKKHLSNLIKK